MERLLLCFLMMLLTISCQSVSNRVQLADDIAASSGMVRSAVKTQDFTYTVYHKITAPGLPVNVYIEGDGFAVAQQGRISSNPTPRDPLALRLATLDEARNVLYIARPCQYTSFEVDRQCSPIYWSYSRFSEKVIRSVDSVLSAFVKKNNFSDIHLVGYSGGAAVAVMLAVRRTDVSSLRSVAGNLDHKAINRYHRVDQLTDSYNPIDYANKIAHIPQYHFSGAEDNIVPVFIAKQFVKRANDEKQCVRRKVLGDVSHHKGWYERWADLLLLPISCKNIY